MNQKIKFKVDSTITTLGKKKHIHCLNLMINEGEPWDTKLFWITLFHNPEKEIKDFYFNNGMFFTPLVDGTK